MKVILALATCVVLGISNGCSYVLETEKSTVEAAPAPSPVPSPVVEQVVESDPMDLDSDVAEPRFNMQLLETGEFHGDEVNARSGEKWLGLFVNSNEGELIECPIKVKTVVDQIVDDEEKGEKTGKAVSVGGKKEPVFLLRDADFLKPSKVRTVFYFDPNGDEPSDGPKGSSLTNHTKKVFSLNKVSYALSVKTTANNEIYLDESSKLILTDGQIEQTIFSQKRCDDCGWAIYWAGDLDADGKLDLYLDLHDHYNVTHRRLFLSSQTESGQLVKEVANFVTVGC